MKAVRIVIILTLMFWAGSVFGERWEMVHPDYNDTVNSKVFSMIAKFDGSDGYVEGDCYSVMVQVESNSGQELRAMVDSDGNISAGQLEIVAPKPDQLCDPKFPIMARASGYAVGERLSLIIYVRNETSGVEFNTLYCQVTTK